MKISDYFDSGAIKVVDIKDNKATLEIPRDDHADFSQWFYFRVTLNEKHHCLFELVNAGEASYPQGWENYYPFYSYDRKHWYRVDIAEYDGQTLKFELDPSCQCFYIAYFVPYTYEQHLTLLHTAQLSNDCQLLSVCQTLDGRDLDLLKIGSGNKIFWLTARQHPGETMAEWFIEGFVERLLNKTDPIAKHLLNEVTFYIVPNMNPDGSVRGNLRTNASGANLNREWLTPSPEHSPEVFYIKQWMEQTGVDFYLDVHGDEAIPYNFVAGNEGVPNYTPAIAKLEERFKTILLNVSQEFQDQVGYEKTPAGQSDLLKASDFVGNEHHCLAFTLEMPFKDNDHFPDRQYGWSTTRCKQFAYDVLITLSKLSSAL